MRWRATTSCRSPVFATLFGIALSRMGTRARPVVDFLDVFTQGVFSIVGMIMRLAPIAAFGAMAFTVGKYGLGSIAALGKLMATMYLTCVLFVAIVLGGVARLAGFSLWKFLRYIRDEIFTVLGTSSSDRWCRSSCASWSRPGCRSRWWAWWCRRA